MTSVQRTDRNDIRADVRRRFPVPPPDEAHWPGLATPPRAPVHAWITPAVVRRAVAPIPVRVVFPGGSVVGTISDTLAAHTSLSIAPRRDAGPHCANTLELWQANFLANRGRLEGAFDDTVGRMSDFCLPYREAGFRVGYLGVSQFGPAGSLCAGS